MRSLSSHEIKFVSGGTQTVVETEIIIYQPSPLVIFVREFAYLVMQIGLNLLIDILLYSGDERVYVDEYYYY